MIADLKPYPDYKDSGVEWLGKVPQHWKILPNRVLFNEIKDRDCPDAQMLSVTIKRGVIRQSTLLEDTAKKDSSNLDRSKYKLVLPGDIAYNKMRAWQGAIGVSNFRGIISPAYVVQRLRTHSEPIYFHQLFRIPPFAKEAERWSYGITSDMWSLRPEHFKLIYSSLPSIVEQQAIVRFLNYTERWIQRYIQAKQKLIKLLEEQKQAIIHQAVTGQIDVQTGQPYPAYKDSGVEWIAQVPAHWEVRRSKQTFTQRKELARPDDIQLSATQAYGVIAQDEYERRIGRKVVKIFRHLEKRRHVELDDFVISMRSFQGGLERAWVSGCIRSSYIVLRPIIQVDVGFFSYLFKSRGYIGALQSTADFIRDGQDLNFDNFCGVDLPVPPIDEQWRIKEMLDEAVAGANTAIGRANREIELLQEYRTRLIADVVTGKLDVQQAAADLPEETEESEPPDIEDELMGDMDEAFDMDDEI